MVVYDTSVCTSNEGRSWQLLLVLSRVYEIPDREFKQLEYIPLCG